MDVKRSVEHSARAFLPPNRLVVSSASYKYNGGNIPGIRLASIVFPDPGGPIIIQLDIPIVSDFLIVNELRLILTFACPYCKFV